MTKSLLSVNKYSRKKYMGKETYLTPWTQNRIDMQQSPNLGKGCTS